MRVRAVLQAVVILFALGIGLTIYWNWQPSSVANPRREEPVEAPRPTGGGADEDEDRDIASFTDEIRIRNTKNGRDIFTIWASEQIDFADGWNTWADVRVVIHDDNGAKEIEIRSDRARTTGSDAGAQFNQVVFIGDVVATLPAGGEFTTRRIDYDAVTGEVSNCNRNTLEYAGLEIRADCMQFQTAGEVASATAVAEELRMWGDLKIRKGQDAPEASAGLEGSAEEMRFRPGQEFVYLIGKPSVKIEGATIRGDDLVLDVGPDADELRAIEADGAARVRIVDVGTEESDAESSVGAQTLTGDRVSIEVGESGRVGQLLAETAGGGIAELVLGGFGRLEAEELEMRPGDDGLEARAQRAVTWTPRGADGPLQGLSSGDLSLEVAGGEVRSLDAARGVRAILRGEGGAGRSFRGPRLVLGWAAGELASGSWPEGLTLDLDGRTLEAGVATFIPATRAWVLAGSRRPKIKAPEFDFAAASMTLAPDGTLVASGGVTGNIGGDYLMAAAALFGDVTAVALRAGTATVQPDGALRLFQKVEVVWESQSLVANDLLLENSPGRLRARGAVELVAIAALNDDVSADEAGVAQAIDAVRSDRADYVTLSAENLLVEEATSEVRVAGDASLRQDTRRIGATSMLVEVDEAGEWSLVRAEGSVEFEDEDARGAGAELEYSLATADLRLIGDAVTPATFIYEGVDPPAEYRSDEELRVTQSEQGIIIESTEDGRATTSVVERGIRER
jgi:lipopolysaccharide export system protein LptA